MKAVVPTHRASHQEALRPRMAAAARSALGLKHLPQRVRVLMFHVKHPLVHVSASSGWANLGLVAFVRRDPELGMFHVKHCEGLAGVRLESHAETALPWWRWTVLRPVARPGPD